MTSAKASCVEGRVAARNLVAMHYPGVSFDETKGGSCP